MTSGSFPAGGVPPPHFRNNLLGPLIPSSPDTWELAQEEGLVQKP